MRTALRAGPVTPGLRLDFEQHLDQARREWDARIAAVLSPDRDRYSALIRGGLPDAAEWASACKAAAVTGRRAVADGALRAIASEAMRTMSAQSTTEFVEIDPSGITVTTAELDQYGSPQLRRLAGTKRWADLLPFLSAAADDQRFQLAGGIHSLDRQLLTDALRHAVPVVTADRVIVICRPTGWRLLEEVAELTAAARTGSWRSLTSAAELTRSVGPAAWLVCAGTVADGSDGGALLDLAAASMPLLRAYGAVVAMLDPATGCVTTQIRPLFAPGDQPGVTASLSLRRIPGDRGDVTLAVMVSDGAQHELLSVAAIPLPSTSRYRILAVLDGPGRVRFTEPAGITVDRKPWPETLAAMPAQMSVQIGPMDLVCAIELGGERGVVARRRALVGDLLALLEAEHPEPDLLRISLLGCTDHVFEPGLESRPVVQIAPLAPIADARRALARLLGADVRNPRAAPLEDLLDQAAEQLAGSRGQGRAARLLLVAGRPPHPYPQLPRVNACPRRIRWRAALDRIVRTHGAWCVAVADSIPVNPERAEIWQRLGQTSLRELASADARQLGEDLGVFAGNSQRITIPLADQE